MSATAAPADARAPEAAPASPLAARVAKPQRIPLFPLNSVLFPSGLLSLKVFEARYHDLIADCLRDKKNFGVVAIRRGSEVRDRQGPPELESIGCEARIIDVDAASTPGVLKVRCRGLQRFLVDQSFEQPDGLLVADVTWVAPDAADLPPVELAEAVNALASTVSSMRSQGRAPFLEPMDYADVGWVANRWCELLPISVAARQQLMALTDPVVRLRLVDQFLRSKGILSAARH